MSNNALTSLKILQETMRVLENDLSFTRYVNRQYSKEFAQVGAKIGYTVNARRPVRSNVTTGINLAVQDYVETYVPVTLTNQDHVDMSFTSQELTLQIDDFSERIIKPNSESLANAIDFNGLGQYLNVANWGGTPGVYPNTALAFLSGGALLDSLAAPKGMKRSCVIDPFTQAYMVDSLKGLFNPSGTVSDQYSSGNMGQALGFKWSMDQNVRKHQPGVLGGSPLVNGAQSGTAPTGILGSTGANALRSFPLLTKGWTAAALQRVNAGDVFTLAGVYSVNPQNRQSTGQLQQFVATANGSSDGTGAMTLNIYPYPIFSGQYQNVTSVSGNIPDNTPLVFSYAANAAGTVYPQNLLFHEDAFTLATADLILPEGVAMRARVNHKGISMRLVKQYRIGTDDMPCRVDVLYGWQTMYPELAYRLTA